MAKNGFPWGIIVRTHIIGDIAITEYLPNQPSNVDDDDFDPAVRFHPYTNGEDTNHSYLSLEEAVVHAIAMKHDGINTQAGTFFMRAIGVAS